jgi:hypothetical protein
VGRDALSEQAVDRVSSWLLAEFFPGLPEGCRFAWWKDIAEAAKAKLGCGDKTLREALHSCKNKGLLECEAGLDAKADKRRQYWYLVRDRDRKNSDHEPPSEDG